LNCGNHTECDWYYKITASGRATRTNPIRHGFAKDLLAIGFLRSLNLMTTLETLMTAVPSLALTQPWAHMTPRYLVPIEPKRCGHFFTDVLIIGGGLAGLRAAHEVDPSLRTLILTKDKLEEANSTYAQG